MESIGTVSLEKSGTKSTKIMFFGENENCNEIYCDKRHPVMCWRRDCGLSLNLTNSSQVLDRPGFFLGIVINTHPLGLI